MNITVGVMGGNEVEPFFHEEDTLNGDYLAALHDAETDEEKARIIEHAQDFWEANPVYLVGKFKTLPDNSVELGMLEGDNDFSAEYNSNGGDIIIHQSRWAIRCAECSPAFFGCGDCSQEGEVIAYCLPPVFIREEIKPGYVNRMFMISNRTEDKK